MKVNRILQYGAATAVAGVLAIGMSVPSQAAPPQITYRHAAHGPMMHHAAYRHFTHQRSAHRFIGRRRNTAAAVGFGVGALAGAAVANSAYYGGYEPGYGYGYGTAYGYGAPYAYAPSYGPSFDYAEAGYGAYAYAPGPAVSYASPVLGAYAYAPLNPSIEATEDCSMSPSSLNFGTCPNSGD